MNTASSKAFYFSCEFTDKIHSNTWVDKKICKQWNVVTDLIQSDLAPNKDIWLLRVVILFARCQYLHRCPYFYHSCRIYNLIQQSLKLSTYLAMEYII